MKISGIACAWMRKSDWPKWLEIDPEFQPDYDHWLGRMNNAIASIQAQGTPVIKVLIEPAEFVAWAKEHGKGVSTAERAEYAVRKAAEADKKGERH